MRRIGRYHAATQTLCQHDHRPGVDVGPGLPDQAHIAVGAACDITPCPTLCRARQNNLRQRECQSVLTGSRVSRALVKVGLAITIRSLDGVNEVGSLGCRGFGATMGPKRFAMVFDRGSSA